jgi:hypothetical protein
VLHEAAMTASLTGLIVKYEAAKRQWDEEGPLDVSARKRASGAAVRTMPAGEKERGPARTAGRRP